MGSGRRDLYDIIDEVVSVDPSDLNCTDKENVHEVFKDFCTKLSELTVSASPGFTWGRSGNASSGTWLLNDSVPSNKSGRAIFIDDPQLSSLFVRCESIDTFDLEVYEHDGTVFTLITTVSIIASRAHDVTFPTPIPLTKGKELAIKLVNGSAKNPVVGCLLGGSI